MWKRVGKGGAWNTFRLEAFEYLDELRLRVATAQARLVRKRTTGKRTTSLSLCLRGADGTYDRYPDHTEGGHLIALELGGVDHSYNVVPMYAGFNRVVWRELERAIRFDEAIIDLRVEVDYSRDDPRRPAVLEVLYAKHDKPWKNLVHMRMNQPPVTANYTISDRARKILKDAADAMKGANWTFERIEEGWPLPDKNERMYAVLDYLLFAQPDQWEQLLMELGLQSKRVTVSRGRQFSKLQYDVMLRVNYVFHGDRALSDGPSGKLLLLGSTTDAPQVDHIYAMSRSGPNAFSNARVVSALENVSKGTKPLGP